MTITADVLVIGAGMAGIGAAARLSSNADVIVLERETAIGCHSTGRSAAILVQNYGNMTLRALTTASLPVFENGELSETPLLTKRGEMTVAGAAQLGTLDALLAEGVGLERLTRNDAVALCPILRPERIAGAAIEANARDIDVEALLQGYSRLLRANGGRIDTGVAIRLMRRSAHWLIETDDTTYEAPIIINAAGAWADQVASMAGVQTIGLQPRRRSAAILPAPTGIETQSWPMVAAVDESWYFKPLSGKLMVSPADEDPVEPHDAWPDDMVLAEGLDRFAQATTYAVTRVEHSWAGLRSFAPDNAPVAGYAPDAEGFFWLAGQGGHGIQTSPALSQLTADLIGGNIPALPSDVVTALTPTRFTANISESDSLR